MSEASTAPVDTMKDEDAEMWRLSANCLGADPEVFFPERGAGLKEARAICQGCEVSSPCLEYALANEEKHGVWGGLSERERRRIIRERKTAKLRGAVINGAGVELSSDGN